MVPGPTWAAAAWDSATQHWESQQWLRNSRQHGCRKAALQLPELQLAVCTQHRLTMCRPEAWMRDFVQHIVAGSLKQHSNLSLQAIVQSMIPGDHLGLGHTTSAANCYSHLSQQLIPYAGRQCCVLMHTATCSLCWHLFFVLSCAYQLTHTWGCILPAGLEKDPTAQKAGRDSCGCRRTRCCKSSWWQVMHSAVVPVKDC